MTIHPYYLSIAIVFTCVAPVRSEPERPLKNAHSHNDYLREHPLQDALRHGFTSIEADIFLVDGKLLVAHERATLDPKRTLESLYLAPLARRVSENGGYVYPGYRPFFLLIDIKTGASETYSYLNKELAKYADMLTTVEDVQIFERAVTVVISGNRPYQELIQANPRYAAYDGRMADLVSDAAPHLMPMISDNWRAHFRWNGNGPMPESERAKLRDIVRKAHDAKRVVRFWATPENEAVWTELHAVGVDLINTDQLGRLEKFLRGL